MFVRFQYRNVKYFIAAEEKSRKNLTDSEIYELQSQTKYLRQTLVFM